MTKFCSVIGNVSTHVGALGGRERAPDAGKPLAAKMDTHGLLTGIGARTFSTVYKVSGFPISSLPKSTHVLRAVLDPCFAVDMAVAVFCEDVIEQATIDVVGRGEVAMRTAEAVHAEASLGYLELAIQLAYAFFVINGFINVVEFLDVFVAAFQTCTDRVGIQCLFIFSHFKIADVFTFCLLLCFLSSQPIQHHNLFVLQNVKSHVTFF